MGGEVDVGHAFPCVEGGPDNLLVGVGEVVEKLDLDGYLSVAVAVV